MESKKKKHLLTVVLASLIIVSGFSASVMTGCGCDNSTATPDTAVKTTEVVTQIVENTYYIDDEGNKIVIDDEGKEFIVDDEGNVISEVTENKQNEASENGASNSGSSQASSQSSSTQNSGENSENSEANEGSQSSKPASSNTSSSNTNNNSGVLSVDGNKFNVGDTITCTYKFTAPEVLENYEGIIKYDNKYLTVKSARLQPPASSGGILNFKLRNEIKFNGSNISGAYDFTNGENFMIVTYEVTASGSTTTSEEWVAVTGVSQKAYVSGDKLANGAKITKTYSK